MNPEVEFVKRIVSDITGSPDCFDIDRSVDENGVLLVLTVEQAHAGRVIGKNGAAAQSMRTLLRALGMMNAARYSLKIEVREP